MAAIEISPEFVPEGRIFSGRRYAQRRSNSFTCHFRLESDSCLIIMQIL